MAASSRYALPPPKSSLQSLKSLETWISERPYGCQKQHLFWCLLQKMSFNTSRCHLTSISGIRSLEDRKSSLKESWCSCSGRPYGCQKQLLFRCLLQKMPFNPSRCHLSSISGVGSLEDRNGYRQESAFYCQQ